MRRARDRTSSSLCRTTAASGSAGPPRRNPRYRPGISPAVDVVVALHEKRPLHRLQPGIVHPVSEQAPHDRQEIEVAVVGRRRARIMR